MPDIEEIFMAFTLAFVIIKSFDEMLKSGEELTCSGISSWLHDHVDATEMAAVFGCEFHIDSNVLGHALIRFQRKLITNSMSLNWKIAISSKRKNASLGYKAFGQIAAYENYEKKVSFLNESSQQYNNRQSWIQRYDIDAVIADSELLSLISCELLDKQPSISHCITQLCGPVVLLEHCSMKCL